MVRFANKLIPNPFSAGNHAQHGGKIQIAAEFLKSFSAVPLVVPLLILVFIVKSAVEGTLVFG